MIPPEIQDNLNKIDDLGRLFRPQAMELLQMIHQLFPLTTMSPKFKGTHSLVLDKSGKLSATIWYKNRAYNITFD